MYNKKYCHLNYSLAQLGDGLVENTILNVSKSFPEAFVSFGIFQSLNYYNISLKMRTSLVMAKDRENEPSIILTNSTINICNIFNGLIGGFLIKIIFNDYSKYSNLTLKCPIEKGVYHVQNSLITEKFVPDQLRQLVKRNTKFRLFQTFYSKDIAKPMVKVCEINVIFMHT